MKCVTKLFLKQENAKKRATANVHRTLEDMQLSTPKEHWWQRIFKF